MRYEHLVQSVGDQLALMVPAVAEGPVTAPVATCGDWTVAELAYHVGAFCGFWAHVLCEGTGRPKAALATGPGTGEGSGAPDAAELAAWLEAAGRALLEELRATPPDTTTWSWFPDGHTASFVARRCAHELAVHRYDAQAARGVAAPIGAPLAADGIDELFGTLTAARPPSGRATGQTLHVHGTDPGVDAEWLVTLGANGVAIERRHAKGDLALRGAAGDLLLLLYRRPPLGEVERLGDDSVLDAWYGEFIF